MGKSYIITATSVAGRKFIKLSGLTPSSQKTEELKEREEEFIEKFPGFKQANIPGQGQGQAQGGSNSDLNGGGNSESVDFFFEIPQLPGTESDNTLPTYHVQKILDHFAWNARAFSVTSSPVTTVPPISHMWTITVSY